MSINNIYDKTNENPSAGPPFQYNPVIDQLRNDLRLANKKIAKLEALLEAKQDVIDGFIRGILRK